MTIAEGSVPGPLTKRLTDAYAELVDCDFVAQYQSTSKPEPSAAAAFVGSARRRPVAFQDGGSCYYLSIAGRLYLIGLN